MSDLILKYGVGCQEEHIKESCPLRLQCNINNIKFNFLKSVFLIDLESENLRMHIYLLILILGMDLEKLRVSFRPECHT